jgi:CRP/FNR family cyclic AMP-dependent transcriptional regulator
MSTLRYIPLLLKSLEPGQEIKIWRCLNLKTQMNTEHLDWMPLIDDLKTRHKPVYRHIPKGSCVYLPSDPADSIFLIKEGRVSISKLTEEGKEVTLMILSPGEIFGELALVDERLRDQAAEAIDDVLLCEFKNCDFRHFLRSRPDLAFRVTELIGHRLRIMEARIVDLICKDVTTRVAELLIHLEDQQGKPNEGRDRRKIKLSHQDVANLVGVSRQTMTKTLDSLKSKGLIDLGHRTIIIKDRSGLEVLIQGG